jgi:hypothetical protein
MNRTRNWMAFLTVVGSFFAAAVALTPSASAHTCSEDYISSLPPTNHNDCGGCEKGSHDHNYTLGPLSWDRCSSCGAATEAEISTEIEFNPSVALACLGAFTDSL